MYGLPENYKTNPICYIKHTVRDASMFQIGVYKYVQKLLKDNKLRSILDIGCGVPEKLKKYILPVTTDIVGLDLPDCIEIAKKRFSFGQWLPFNIDKSSELTFDRKFDVILASDVIEHLENPDTLLNFIKRQSNEDTFIILSTPERDTLSGAKKTGPPIDCYHVREWNRIEFIEYLQSRKFYILQSLLFDEPGGYKCHACVCNHK